MTEQNKIYAGFWIRLLAYMIDFLVTFFIGIIIGFIFGLIIPKNVMLKFFLFYHLVGILVTWIYYASMESSSKQGTLGKMALGLKVVDFENKRINFGRATGRFFGKILSGILLGIGFIMIAFTQKKQGLHDMIADTFVIKK